MSESAQILALWHDAKQRGEQCALATVVRVEGSSYRKPGARMLITPSGKRAGNISGGCLEAEVIRKAFWLTENGPTIQRYQTSLDEDGSMPFGLGCGGAVFLLLERGDSLGELMSGIEKSIVERLSSVIVTVIDTNSKLLSRRLILPEGGTATGLLSDEPAILSIASTTLMERRSSWHTPNISGERTEVFAEYLPRATSLLIFGAGDDAQPVVAAASALGWQITVADGRVNLVRQERFPLAHRIIVTELREPLRGVDIGLIDAAVLMTHSFDQDRAALTALLQTAIPYIGVLGPPHRTAELLKNAASATALDPHECMRRLHAPVGLDIGADNPASIALSIVAEIFSTLRARSSAPLSAQRMKTTVGISA